MRAAALTRELRDIGRSVVGALLLGLPLLYTMETWWLGWRLPAWMVLTYAFGGLVLVSVVVHHVGFHKGHAEKEEHLRKEVLDFFELFMTSFLTGVLVLFMFGIIEFAEDLGDVVRLALIQVVPLGLGAAITNRALGSAESENKESVDFRREGAIFALGAIFFILPVAPTEEMELIAAHAGPYRMVGIVVASLLVDREGHAAATASGRLEGGDASSAREGVQPQRDLRKASRAGGRL